MNLCGVMNNLRTNTWTRKYSLCSFVMAKEPKPSSPCFGFTLFSTCVTGQSGERKELAIYNRSDTFSFLPPAFWRDASKQRGSRVTE
jgi:hypothetical protein